MKHEQVVVDYWVMLKTSAYYLLLAFMGYIFLKMVQAIFWLPGYIQKNQERLEKIGDQYSPSSSQSEQLETDDVSEEVVRTESEEPANEEELKKLK